MKRMMLLCMLLVGCAEPSEEDLDDEGEVTLESAEQALLPATIHDTWQHGNGPRKLAPYGSYFCYLKYVRGQFAGSDYWVNVFGQNGYWYVNGNSPYSSRIVADVECVALDNNGQKWKFENGVLWSQGEASKQLGASTKRVCLLTAMGGDFRGTSEKIQTFTSGNKWYVGGSSSRTGVWTMARCLVGNDITPTSYSTEAGNPVFVGNVVTCGLSRISGKFPNDSYYVGVGQGVAGGQFLSTTGAATAQCFP